MTAALHCVLCFSHEFPPPARESHTDLQTFHPSTELGAGTRHPSGNQLPSDGEHRHVGSTACSCVRCFHCLEYRLIVIIIFAQIVQFSSTLTDQCRLYVGTNPSTLLLCFHRGPSWVPVSTCQDVRHPLVCNLTEAFSDPMPVYFAAVVAQLKARSSQPATSVGFQPIKDSE